MSGPLYGAIEAGGTKWVCAVGTGPDELTAATSLPTTTPDATLAAASNYLTSHGPLVAVGVGSFGPVDVRAGSPTWGRITNTPKPGWADTDVAGYLGAVIGVPIGFDTDVNAAALGEQRWGAGMGLSTFCYVTIGTGIGAGVVANGDVVHGLLHPEFGHMLLPHDRQHDPFPGVCPYHGDCLEGLASGAAIAARWGRRGEELAAEHVWRLEADYLAHGLVNLLYAVSPQRIIIGGGVMKALGLLELVRGRVRELVADYVDADALRGAIDHFLVAPELGDRAGVVGALELARRASERSATQVPRALAEPVATQGAARMP